MRRLSCFLSVIVVLATGCATHPGATARSNAVPFDTAVDMATDDLVAQTQKMHPLLAEVESKILKGTIAVDPFLDGVTGQQTVVSQRLETRMVDRFRQRFPQFQVRPLDGAAITKADYILTGTISREPGGAGAPETYKISVSLTEVKTSSVTAQASTRSSADGIDTNPTPYYRDSPVITRDNAVDRYIGMTTTGPGQRANATYLQGLALSALMNDALAAYNNGQHADALALYQQAAAHPEGQQLRVYSGLYLTNWNLGRQDDAEQAFAKLVKLALASDRLDIKFLFRPNSTDFWPDTRLSGAYPMWLRQIARQVAENRTCLNLIGHTSRTGAEDYNDRLSQQRAASIEHRLQTEVPQLAGRLQASGVGFRENIVGTGTDDLRDSLDRRVEFRVTSCANA